MDAQPSTQASCQRRERQLEWRVGVELATGRYRISHEYRANEGGSGEPMGVFAVTW